ncbi:hypothetical protein [Geodermatophilus sp. SYSU D00684]
MTRIPTPTPARQPSPTGARLRWMACWFGAPLDPRLLPWRTPR